MHERDQQTPECTLYLKMLESLRYLKFINSFDLVLSVKFINCVVFIRSLSLKRAFFDLTASYVDFCHGLSYNTPNSATTSFSSF